MASSSLDSRVDPEEEASSELERPGRRRSTFSLMREAILSATHIVEDSTELIGASIREELERFRNDLARQALSVVAICIGGAFVTAGLALFLNDLIHNWALTLVLFGVLYFGIALAVPRLGGGGSSE